MSKDKIAMPNASYVKRGYAKLPKYYPWDDVFITSHKDDIHTFLSTDTYKEFQKILESRVSSLKDAMVSSSLDNIQSLQGEIISLQNTLSILDKLTKE